MMLAFMNKHAWEIALCVVGWWILWTHVGYVGDHLYETAVTKVESSVEWQSKLIRLSQSQRQEINDEELIVTALTLFGSAKRPGEAYLDNNIEAQLAVLDSARNRARVCGTTMRDEFLKWGYSKKENKYKAMYSVWEDGGPKIGFSDIKRFSKALTQARKVILLSRATSLDKKITHYHQTGMKSPPAWSNVFDPIKKIGGNSFYQEVSGSGSYCNAFVPKSIPIPVKIKPRGRKEKAVVADRDGDKVNTVVARIEKIRRMLRKK